MGLLNVATGQPLVEGTPDWEAWKQATIAWNTQAGYSAEQIAASVTPGAVGYGMLAINNPVANAYSSQFALENVNGGGLEWVKSVGGLDGFAANLSAASSSSASSTPSAESGRTNAATVAVTSPTVSNNPPPAGTNNSGTINASDTPTGINWLAIGLLAGGALLVYKLMKG